MDKQQIVNILNKNNIKDDNLANALSELQKKSFKKYHQVKTFIE